MPAITCAMCGTRYDPAEHAACQNCPLHPRCSLTCCPNCGYTGVDPEASTVLRWLRPIWRRGRRRRRNRLAASGRAAASGSRLDQVPPGSRALITDLGRLPMERRQRLEGMGLCAGQPVEVLAQAPVTVVSVGHAQLALAAELSRMIEVLALDNTVSAPVGRVPRTL